MRTRKTVRLGAGALVVAATSVLGGCGTGGTTQAGGGVAAAEAPAVPLPTASAVAVAGALAAPPPGFPARETYMESGEEAANDGDARFIPQGMTKAEAMAAGLGTDGLPVLTVTGTDTDCFANTATVAPGETWFVLENRSQLVNEMYLVRDGVEIIEIEDLMFGDAGAFKFGISASSKWIIACEPGQADKQYRFPLTVA